MCNQQYLAREGRGGDEAVVRVEDRLFLYARVCVDIPIVRMVSDGRTIN